MTWSRKFPCATDVFSSPPLWTADGQTESLPQRPRRSRRLQETVALAPRAPPSGAGRMVALARRIRMGRPWLYAGHSASGARRLRQTKQRQQSGRLRGNACELGIRFCDMLVVAGGKAFTAGTGLAEGSFGNTRGDESIFRGSGASWRCRGARARRASRWSRTGWGTRYAQPGPETIRACTGPRTALRVAATPRRQRRQRLWTRRLLARTGRTLLHHTGREKLT